MCPPVCPGTSPDTRPASALRGKRLASNGLPAASGWPRHCEREGMTHSRFAGPFPGTPSPGSPEAPPAVFGRAVACLPAPAPSPPVLDLDGLLGMVAGDRGVAREVARMFLEDAADQVARVATLDADGAARELHDLKGASGTLHALAFRNAVVRLERGLRPATAFPAEALLVSLRFELERLREELARAGLAGPADAARAEEEARP